MVAFFCHTTNIGTTTKTGASTINGLSPLTGGLPQLQIRSLLNDIS